MEILNIAKRIKTVYDSLTNDQKERLRNEEIKVREALLNFLAESKFVIDREPTLRELKTIASDAGIPYASRSNTYVLTTMLERKKIDIMVEVIKLRRKEKDGNGYRSTKSTN